MLCNSLRKGAVVFAAPCFVLAAVASPALADEQTTRLEPVSGWHVELTDGICRLSRSYSADGRNAVLALEHFGERNAFSITVAGAAVARAKTTSASVQFGPFYMPQERDVERGRIKGLGEAMLLGSGGLVPSQAEPADDPLQTDEPVAQQTDEPISPISAADVEWLRIEQYPGSYLRFPLPNFGEAFAVLDQCVDAMIEGWGFDPAKQRTFVKGPKVREQDSWVDDIQFPIRELREGFDGRIWLRFNVDAEGRPTACSTIKLADTGRFDNACEDLLRIARFEPARDHEGKPAASYLVVSIQYDVY
jgi:TonB family protein